MSSFWIQFFKDAGIPSAAVKSYAGIFEENRITRDMLLDLNKEILLDMGIKVMGDIISILKHARKVYNQELKRKEKFGPTNSDAASAVAQIPAVSTTMVSGQAREQDLLGDSSMASDAWAEESHNEIMPPPTSHRPDEPGQGQGVGDVERYHPVVNTSVHHGTLRSDQILMASKSSGLRFDVALDVAQPQNRYPEEYTTAAYESRIRRKRGMYADEIESSRSDEEVCPPKQTRKVVTPAGGSGSPAALSPHQQSTGTFFSQRVLEAAGLHSRGGLDASRVVQNSQSVFQRLDRSGGKDALQEQGKVTRDITVEAKRSKVKPDVRSRLVVVRGSKTNQPKSSVPRREATMVADKVEQKTAVHLRVDRTRLGPRKGW
ncbi:hypothetical protein EMCRGX_G032228 [Ephydatia muelleri]